MHTDFSAALIAGGKSSRMGEDKAALVVEGVPLWQRQIDVLRGSGVGEIFISGRPSGPYAASGLSVVEDDEADAGPMTGLRVSLEQIRTPLLLVLAVDMPLMDSVYLRKLVSLCQPGLGVVPQRGELFEPLAAVYPREAREIAERHRNQPLQRFVQCCLEAGLVQTLPVSVEEERHFMNLNTPDDVSALRRTKKY